MDAKRPDADIDIFRLGGNTLTLETVSGRGTQKRIYKK